jgi:hypothetical protein
MSTRDHSNEQGRLFCMLVLMGSSLALGCGGTAEQMADAAGGTAGTSGSANTGGSTGGGGATSGGAWSGGATSTGGVTFTGGTSPGGATSVGGTAGGSPTHVRPAEFDCPYEQVSCGSCSSAFDEYELPSWASCNYEAPVSAADCAPGERFVCLEATVDENGGRFPTGVRCGCYCTTELDCSNLCGNEIAATCLEYPAPNAPAGQLDSILCSGCLRAPFLK